jgi:chaperonin GroES
MEQENFSALLESVNIAEKLDEDKLKEIGQECKKGFEQDLETCADWMKSCEDWLKLAKQTIEQKTYPWPGASNVKYPLLSTAAMQFAARAYPSLVPSDGRVVKAKAIGKDPFGSKTNVAEAVSIYMSYQLMYEMDGWEEDMDKLLITLPIVGTIFKKTYWDSMKKVNCSRVVMPNKLVVDYWTDSLCEAERISEIVELSPRKVKERQQSGVWLDVELGQAQVPEGKNNAPALDAITPYEFVEQHTYLDLDDDGYREPYIVTFQRTTGEVVRITARFDEDTIYTDDEGKLIAIEAIQYYTKFGFVPNPDGSFYDIGFGVLLGPLNESVNTLINQLVDAGHLASLQGGFLGKGLRLRGGEQRFTPGEWKVVNATGDDLKKQVVPLPAAEPSKVLLELMTSLVSSGKELASVAEIFTGKMPGQNTPATTTMATVEQGMKVFTAVYKRIYRSLSEEFKKLYRLNAIYLNPRTYQDVVDMEVGQEDFKIKSYQIYPGADPTAVSQTERLLKAQGLVELAPMFPGMLNPVEIVNRVLEAQEQPNKEALLSPEVQQSGQWQPPPDPKAQEMQMKSEMEQQKIQMQGQAKQQEMQMKERGQQVELAMKQEAHAQEIQHEAEMLQVKRAEALHKQRIFQVEGAQKVMHAEQDHQQKLRQGEEQSKAKVQQTKAQAKAKPKAKGPTKK